MRRLIATAAAAATLACGKSDRPIQTTAQATTASPPGPECVVSDSAIGRLKLGMTVSEAKSAWPEATFSRTSDGEGVALIDVSVGADQMVIAYAREDDAAAPVDSTKPMNNLETFSDKCGTVTGVHPGMLVTEAERILGKTRSVARSEIESREFIEFESQPVWMTIRLGPESKILSIAIAAR